MLFLLSFVVLMTAYHLGGRATASGVLLSDPGSAIGASIELSPAFSSLSIEPAFWTEFVGTASQPNQLFFDLLTQITERGGLPLIRPGGITMDSMVFDSKEKELNRTMGFNGAVYRTSVGPSFFDSWSNFPPGIHFISTLNFGNNSFLIASDLAVASVKHQAARIQYFELGNEPTNYPRQRWNYKAQAYVNQWRLWTKRIDDSINRLPETSSAAFGSQRWWASSATTGNNRLKLRPIDIIPLGIDSENAIGRYSIHSYPFGSCSPASSAKATIENLLNHTGITNYADTEIMPSALSALQSGKPWVVGEFNSIKCCGKPGVSDSFTQALWLIDTELSYAVRNASTVHLHQGATLVSQSSTQINTPGFATYNILYPRDSEKYGKARALPSFAALLFLAELVSQPHTRVKSLENPTGTDRDRFAGFAVYQNDRLTKLALLNMQPLYAQSEESSIEVDLSAVVLSNRERVFIKRLTAPSVDEKDTHHILWAGQSFTSGKASGKLVIEQLMDDATLRIRASEAVLVFLDTSYVFGVKPVEPPTSIK